MHYQELKKAWDELTAPGAPFELVVQEVRGAPMKVYKNAPPNVRAVWLSTAAYGDRTGATGSPFRCAISPSGC